MGVVRYQRRGAEKSLEAFVRLFGPYKYIAPKNQNMAIKAASAAIVLCTLMPFDMRLPPGKPSVCCI